MPTVDWVLARYGESAAIAFSGAEDVAVIDMAAATGRKFSVFTLDTGRLHPETYRFIDKVRSRYGVSITTYFPPYLAVEELVRKIVEVARTGTAVSTYNILLGEGRRVAAGLIAVD